MAGLWSRVVAGIRAFREAFLLTDMLDPEDFEDFDSRKVRYAILWAFYESTVYREIHKWAASYKAAHGLYRYIRSIYSPAYRIGEFWKTHLWGGQLDPAAGDGESIPSALPVTIPESNTRGEQLRAALAELWRWSNWQKKKDQLTLQGSVLGDAGLRVVDDTLRRRVYLEIIHPGLIADVETDPFGHIKSYEIQEQRDDPKGSGRTVTYTETAERGEGEAVAFRTYLDGQPYAWNGEESEWVEPYGFIPLVLIEHNDVGLSWGWSELHPARSKIHEVDDLASMLGDRIRKAINAPWLFAGLKKPSSTPAISRSTDSTTKPEAGREDLDALYAMNPNAKAHPLVAPIDFEAAINHISEILKELERDYPELKFDALRASGEVSGRALRVARQPAEAKVVARRAGYDEALVRVQQMALAIGGWRGYEGYEGFDLTSYAKGDLDHSIGKRAVFAVDPMDDLEEEALFWQVANAAHAAGVALDVYLRQHGWAEERVEEIVASEVYQGRLAQSQFARSSMEALEGGNG